MFGKIVYISNNMAHVQLGENVTTDIMNMHVIFEKDGVKILGEVEDIDKEIIKIKLLGEFVDGKTSVQVMEILKKISKDKLIIMVTHNPELAEKYSSRIIRILDGKITDDSAPIEHQKEEKREETKKRTK